MRLSETQLEEIQQRYEQGVRCGIWTTLNLLWLIHKIPLLIADLLDKNRQYVMFD